MSCENCPCSGYLKSSIINNMSLLQEKSLMVIGESPTPAEAASNNVMSGPAGQILREAMSNVGLPTQDTYFTNAIKCALPKKKGFKPPKGCSEFCRDYLLREVDLIRPQLILVCGSCAFQTLFRRNEVKITQEYGNLQEFTYENQQKETRTILVIPVMNSGLLMHDPKAYKPFLSILQLASRTFGGADLLDAGETKWHVVKSPEEAKRLWEAMYERAIGNCGKEPEEEMKVVTFDTETTGLDYRTAEFLVMGICFEKNHVYIIPRELRNVVHNFTDDVPWKCHWQNGMYDKKVLWRRNIANPQIDGDSMYMHYSLDETSPHDLEYLAKTYLNAKPYKYKMNQNWKAVTLDSYSDFFEALCERVAVDCDYTRQVVLKLRELLQQADNKPIYDMYQELLVPSANLLSRVEQNGILIDEMPLRTMDEQYTKLLIQIREEIGQLAEPFWDAELYVRDTNARSAPAEFNPGSSSQMSWMVFDRLKLRPRIKRGRGTSKEVLKSIDNPPNLIKKVLEYRKIQKEHSTYVLGLLNARDADGRVRTSFTVHVTATGRLSSKEPNVQNQPSANGVGNIRSAFIAPEGRLLAEVDYQGAELRWLAFLSGCPVLGDVFRQGRNLHNETAMGLFGPGYTKAQKLRAKAVNFGIPYGREAKSLAEEFNISVAEAQAMHDGWLSLYHGARDYLQWCADQVLQGNYLQSPYGRRRRFGLVASTTIHGLQNEARNFVIQSASSDTTTTAAMIMEKTLRQKFDTKIINLVHDSILLEMPAQVKTIIGVKQYTNEIMSSIPKDKFGCTIPFGTDFEIGRNWGELVGFKEDGNYNGRYYGHVFWEENDRIVTAKFQDWYVKESEECGNED